MKKCSLVLICSLVAKTSSYGAVSIAVNAGEFLDSESNLVAETSVWAVIYDADGDGSLPGGLESNSHFVLGDAASVYEAFSGQSIESGNSLGLDRILWAGIVDGNNTSGAAGIGGVDFDNFTFSSLNVAANGMWAVYWFPGLTETQRLLPVSGFEIGAIQIDSADTVAGGDIGMRFPASDDTGSSFSALFYNETNGGFTPDSNFTAITVVPEPSALAFLACGAFALLHRRRV